MPPSAPEVAIRVRALRKSFGRQVALAGLDLTVPRGEIHCLLGPNGAGKTTVVRILSTLLRPDGGSAEVAGVDVVRRPDLVRTRIGLAGQYAAVDPALTGRENVALVARLYHVPRAHVARRTGAALEALDLGEVGDRPVRTYSGGTRRRLDLAASLVGEPSVIFLDEPTTGLDPRARLAIWELLRSLAAGGTTLLLTTQYLEEADALADRVGVLGRGALVAEGTPAELKQLVGGDVVCLGFDRRDDAVRTAALLGQPAVAPVADGRLSVVRVAVEDDLPLAQWRLARLLDGHGLRPETVTWRAASLEDVFLAFTGRATDGREDGA